MEGLLVCGGMPVRCTTSTGSSLPCLNADLYNTAWVDPSISSISMRRETPFVYQRLYIKPWQALEQGLEIDLR